jgi:hypothetical protein
MCGKGAWTLRFVAICTVPGHLSPEESLLLLILPRPPSVIDVADLTIDVHLLKICPRVFTLPGA